MKHLFIIAMFLCVGMAANAQEAKDTANFQGNYVLCIPFEKVIMGGNLYKSNSYTVDNTDKLVGEIKNTLVMGFNPYTLKMWILAPTDDHQKVEQTVQAYLGGMSSLKNEYFKGCKGDTLWFEASKEHIAKRDSVAASFADEAWQGLSKYNCKKVSSYDPYTDKAQIKSYGWQNAELTKGIESWLLNTYIKKKTKGHFSNVDDFQKALKQGDEKAIKYAKKMK